MSVYQRLESIRKDKGCVAVALIDPDKKNDSALSNIVSLVNDSGFDVIFVGGSLISDNAFETRIQLIKENTDLPVVIFPGSSNQLSANADAVLFLSLISGRNPQYLIGEHVKSAPVIYNLNLETIATAYILLEGGNRSSVEIMSNTTPLPMNKRDIILAHALAGQFLGNKLVFLEAGSGAENHAAVDIVSCLHSHLDIPMIVGGGIYSTASATSLAKNGAGYIVTGTQLEQSPTLEYLKKFTDSIHQ